MEMQTKAIVTVTEMARMVGLSRARFYQLIGSAFPWPSTMCPLVVHFMSKRCNKICLEVRRRNCGIDGKPILFYARPIRDTDIKNTISPIQKDGQAR